MSLHYRVASLVQLQIYMRDASARDWRVGDVISSWGSWVQNPAVPAGGAPIMWDVLHAALPFGYRLGDGFTRRVVQVAATSLTLRCV